MRGGRAPLGISGEGAREPSTLCFSPACEEDLHVSLGSEVSTCSTKVYPQAQALVHRASTSRLAKVHIRLRRNSYIMHTQGGWAAVGRLSGRGVLYDVVE